MECSLPGSSVHGIFQARILEWVAVSFSRGPTRPRDQTLVSCTEGRCFTLWASREALSGEHWGAGKRGEQLCLCFWNLSSGSSLLLPFLEHHRCSYAHPRGVGILTGSPKWYLNIPFLRLFLWWGWRVWSQSGFFHPAPTGDFELSWPHSQIPCLGSCCLSGAYLSLSVVFPFDGRDFMQLQDIRYRVRLLLLWEFEFLMRVVVGFGGKSDGMRIRVLRFWNCSECFQVPWITYGNCGSLSLALVYA